MENRFNPVAEVKNSSLPQEVRTPEGGWTVSATAQDEVEWHQTMAEAVGELQPLLEGGYIFIPNKGYDFLNRIRFENPNKNEIFQYLEENMKKYNIFFDFYTEKMYICKCKYLTIYK